LFAGGGTRPPAHGGDGTISNEPRVNDRIRVPQVRLIGVDGSQLGIYATEDAMRIADEQALDLVEVSPNADPPVCRVMDYGKYKYEQDMKAKKARKHQHVVKIKEIKFRPKVDVHDYETKKRHVVRFLTAGAKVKVTIMFRGREMAHPERGMEILDRLAEELSDLATVEAQPKLEGRNMFMMIAPIPDKEGGAKAKDKSGTSEKAAKDVEKEPAEKAAESDEAPSDEEAPAEKAAESDESPSGEETPAAEPQAAE
jgi:translation initiation factor IF-3